MKVFTNKGLIRKILIVLIVIILFEYAIPTNVSNADFGGVLFTPIQMLTLSIGDVAATGLNLFVLNQKTLPILTLNKDEPTALKFLTNAYFNITLGVGGFIIKEVAKTVKNKFGEDDFVDEIELPVVLVTPDRIFSNEIPLLDVNIINPKEYENDEGKKVESAVSILQSTISNWYTILRDICIVAFLSILVYIGIRILISSASESKAKYKQMLFDWIIGLCLLFIIHYIMSFALLLTDKITELVDINNEEGIMIESDDVDLADFNADKEPAKETVEKFNGNGVGKLSWKTDLMGYIRFFAQKNINSHSGLTQVAYTFMYIVLVIYTYMFLFQYLKRLLSIVFLTLISPFVALAYPLEKVNGNSQAFNMWLKEYIFNLLLQPMHLILYTVFIGSAIDLVTNYPIYAVVVLGFLLEAEKFVRKMFGFDKESLTGAAASGMFTGAMVMHGLNAVLNKGKKGSSGSSKESNKKMGDANDNRVRLAENRKADDPDGEDDFMRMALSGGSQEDGNNNSNDGNTDPTNPNGKPLDNGNPNGKDNVDGVNPTDPNVKPLGNGDHDNKDNINGVDPTNPRGKPLNNGDEDSDELDKYFQDWRIATKLRNREPLTQDEFVHDYMKDWRKAEKRRKVKSKPAKLISSAGQKVKAANNSKAARYAKGAVRFYAPKVAKAAVKGAAMAVVGGTSAMVAGAAGMATDKPTDVLTYGAGGLVGGTLVGKSIANRAIEAPSNINTKVQEARENIAREAYKDDPTGYKKYLNDRADKEFMRNKQIRAQYQEAFGSSRVDEMMENAKRYREHGITDNDIIIKAMKEKSGEIGATKSVTDNRRIAAAKLASGISNGKDIELMTKRLKNQGYKDNVINDNEEFIRSIRNLKYN